MPPQLMQAFEAIESAVEHSASGLLHGLYLLAVQRLLARGLLASIDYFGRWKALH